MACILITGGAGFIGQNIVRRLDASGDHDVLVYDNQTNSSLGELSDTSATLIDADIRDEAALEKALKGVSAVVHLAADTRVMDSIENPAFNFDVNVVGTFKLLQAARAAGVKRIIAASTGGAIMGDVPPPINEKHVPHPTSPYGAAKLAMEGYLSAYAGSYGIPALALRFSNVYGPGSLHKGSVVAQFFKRILAREKLTVYGDGTQMRDFVFIDDICSAIVSSLETTASGSIQLGSGKGTSVNELIDLMRNAIAGEFEIDVIYEDFRAGETYKTWCDISKAKTELGYAPKMELGAGLKLTWDWFKASASQN